MIGYSVFKKKLKIARWTTPMIGKNLPPFPLPSKPLDPLPVDA